MTSPSSWWKRVPLSHQFLIQTYEWSPEQQRDIQGPSVYVGICLPGDGPNQGGWFRKECKSPQELWDFLRAVDSEPEATLKREFNYTGPAKTKALDISAEMVDDILKDIEI